MSAENAGADDVARGDEQEIEAEQESAEAMDAETDHGDDVAEPPARRGRPRASPPDALGG